MRGFYEDYQKEKQETGGARDRPANNGVPAKPIGFVGRGGTTECSECPLQSGRSGTKFVTTRRNAGTAVAGFFTKLFTAVLYLAATALSSVGLTTLINKPLRDMLFELVRKTFYGG